MSDNRKKIVLSVIFSAVFLILIVSVVYISIFLWSVFISPGMRADAISREVSKIKFPSSWQQLSVLKINSSPFDATYLSGNLRIKTNEECLISISQLKKSLDNLGYQSSVSNVNGKVILKVDNEKYYATSLCSEGLVEEINFSIEGKK